MTADARRRSATPARGSPRLALPALVVLAAEPLYVLVDTAVVGHLGRVPLAALAIGGTVHDDRGLARHACSRTARPAAPPGGSAPATAPPPSQEGVQASWLALGRRLGHGGRRAGRRRAADPRAGRRRRRGGRAARRSGCGSPRSARPASCWRRPATAGCAACRTPAARCATCWAPTCSPPCSARCWSTRPGWAWPARPIANVVAQTVARRAVRPGAGRRAGAAARPRPAVHRASSSSSAATCCVRGAAFQACFLSAAAVAARFGAAALAAHQIALQLWFFCALALDAVAIAAQSLVGAALGAGRRGRGAARSPAGSALHRRRSAARRSRC